MTLAILISLPLGMLAAIYRRSIIDKSRFCPITTGQSVPGFACVMFILGFSPGGCNGFQAQEMGNT